jgi:uncharacterized repeat protein (TIGR01451 family)
MRYRGVRSGRSAIAELSLAGLISLVAISAASSAGGNTLTGVRVDNPNPQQGVAFGFAVAGLGDVDGDGSADFAVGAPKAGRVYVFSGSKLGVLHMIQDPEDLTGTDCQPTPTDPSPCLFGYSVVGVGDVNGDGVEDLAVGSPNSFVGLPPPCGPVPDQPCPQFGRVFIFSGKSGSMIVKLERLDVFLQGVSLAPLGDVNGDSVPDVAIAAAGSPTEGGVVAAFSGANGKTLWTQPPLPAPEGIKGLTFSPLAAVGDVNGDGINDLVLGADCADVGQHSCVGRVYVLSGSDGGVLRVHDDPSALDYDAFGEAVAAVGDQNGDGVADYAVAEPGSSQSASSLIHLFSGATGAAIGSPLVSPVDERNSQSSRRSMAIASVGDKNGDGVDDFWVGGTRSGAAYLLNKHGTALLSSADTIQDSGFGAPMSTIAALPGDLGLDVVVGAPMRPVGSVQAAGAVFLLRPQADLQVTKAATPAAPVPGDTVGYTVTVTNGGPSAAAGVKIIDPIPSGLTFVEGSLADDPACSFDAVLDQVKCLPGTLAAGASFSFDFEARIPDDALASTVVNTAAATAVTADPDSSNNTATVASTVTCDILGTPGDDVLVGSNAGESICGLGGNDELVGLGGNDTLVGGAGKDILHGGTGDDILRGGSAADLLYGQDGADTLFGGAGDDSLFGGPGFDLLDGGTGYDVCKTQGGGGTVSACESGGP